MKSFSRYCLLAVILFSSYKTKNSQPKVKEYFTVPGPLSYNQTSYQLSWSAHPSANYYKQEYLPAGEKSASFTHMLMVEAVTGDIAIKDVVSAKIKELEQRKKTDPMANYQVIENKATGDYLLDFIMSEGNGSNTDVAEWNAYRYANLKGRKGIQLFAYSTRGYGAAVNGFLKNLKIIRQKEISAFAAYKIPAVIIKNE
ncbi:MAG: hypothetical protein ABIU63_09780 [Chitinophagaceae bacterium]